MFPSREPLGVWGVLAQMMGYSGETRVERLMGLTAAACSLRRRRRRSQLEIPVLHVGLQHETAGSGRGVGRPPPTPSAGANQRSAALLRWLRLFRVDGDAAPSPPPHKYSSVTADGLVCLSHHCPAAACSLSAAILPRSTASHTPHHTTPPLALALAQLSPPSCLCMQLPHRALTR